MIPPSVTAARAKEIPHHRTPEFRALTQKVHEQLKNIFCTSHDVYSMTCSGSGAMEASVVSLLSPGDVVLCVNAGKFGHRWVDLCKRYGMEVIELVVPRGETLDPAELQNALRQKPNIKAVFTQLTETSTGVTFDLEAMGKMISGTDAIFVVDAISGLAADRFLPDAWGVDVVVTGSQKALMLPPGLAFISLSQKAWKCVETSTCPKYYFDLKRYRKGHDQGDHPFTPAIGLYIQLEESLRLLQEETIEHIWRRHEILARATRAGMEALGLQLFAKRSSNALTAVYMPTHVDAKAMINIMKTELGVTVAGGQDELKDKIFRIAHLGYIDRFDILAAVGSVEIALSHLGEKGSLGKGITAAQKILAEPF